MRTIFKITTDQGEEMLSLPDEQINKYKDKEGNYNPFQGCARMKQEISLVIAKKVKDTKYKIQVKNDNSKYFEILSDIEMYIDFWLTGEGKNFFEMRLK
jgi:hypothetical protein